MNALRCAKEACWGFLHLFRSAGKQGQPVQIAQLESMCPNSPLHAGRGSRRSSRPDQSCGLKITTVSIPSMPRPFQVKAWHWVPGTVGRAGIPLCRVWQGQGAAKETLSTLLAFPLVSKVAPWISCSSLALHGGTGWAIGITSSWLLHYCKCSQYDKNLG